MINSAANKFSAKPKQLFIVDGIGALLSAFLLGIVLVRLQNYVGIPKRTLYYLAILPCFFAAYDFYCWKRIKQNISLYLNGIAYMNLFYCCLSLGFSLSHSDTITPLGWAYIIVEIIIVFLIAIVELRTAKSIDNI